jgi:hypothetical protein
MRRLLLSIPALILIVTSAPQLTAGSESSRSIKVRVQPCPGAPVEDVDMKIHPSPTDLRAVSADEATLGDDELVLGIVADGRAMDYPIRYLAMYEIVNDHVGDAAAEQD